MKKHGVYHTEIYAMGETYISSVMDTLIAQAFYNSALIAVLDQVIVGNSSMPNDSEENSNLFPLRVPNTFIGRSFSELFNFLCEKKNIVALGLYRYNLDPSVKPYIVTNPPADLSLTDRDMVFVLAKSMIDYEVSDKWGSPLEDDYAAEGTLMATNPDIKKLNFRSDLDMNAEYEVHDYLEKANMENKRRKELKDNAEIVKKLKRRCEIIQRRVEEIGEKIKNRPQALTESISSFLNSMPFKSLKKSAGTLQKLGNGRIEALNKVKDSDSDST